MVGVRGQGVVMGMLLVVQPLVVVMLMDLQGSLHRVLVCVLQLLQYLPMHRMSILQVAAGFSQEHAAHLAVQAVVDTSSNQSGYPWHQASNIDIACTSDSCELSLSLYELVIV